ECNLLINAGPAKTDAATTALASRLVRKNTSDTSAGAQFALAPSGRPFPRASSERQHLRPGSRLGHHEVEHGQHRNEGRVAQRFPPAGIAPVLGGEHTGAVGSG